MLSIGHECYCSRGRPMHARLNKIRGNTVYQDSPVFGTTCMKNVQKHFLNNICVRAKFPCVRSSRGLCARAHAPSLEGTLLTTLARPKTTLTKLIRQHATAESRLKHVIGGSLVFEIWKPLGGPLVTSYSKGYHIGG